MKEEMGMVPYALQNRPRLLPELTFTYYLHSELRGSRRPTMDGFGQIPFSEFYLYAVAHDFTKEEIQDIWSELRLVDLIDLDVRMKHRAATTKNKQG